MVDHGGESLVAFPVAMAQPVEAMGSQGAAELRVCPGCGVVTPPGSAYCEICGEAHGGRVLPVALPLVGRAWARVEVTLPCPHCGTTLCPRPDAVDTGARCSRCGNTTPLEATQWDEAVHLCHSVVDLCFPDFNGVNAPLGIYNPFADVGSQRAFAELPSERIALQSTLHLRVGPGSPLCPRCRAPVTLRALHNGRLTTQCPRCADREAFANPMGLTQRFPTLRAVLSFAGEAATAAGRVEPWWVLIDGLSALRPEVESQKAHGEHEASERAAWEAWQSAEQERRSREAQSADAQAKRDRAERDRREREARAKSDRDGMERALREAQEDVVEVRRELDETRAGAEQARVEAESAMESASALHGRELERLQREAWEASERARVAAAEREAGWQSHDQTSREAAGAMAATLRKRTLALGALAVFLALALVAVLFVYEAL